MLVYRICCPRPQVNDLFACLDEAVEHQYGRGEYRGRWQDELWWAGVSGSWPGRGTMFFQWGGQPYEFVQIESSSVRYGGFDFVAVRRTFFDSKYADWIWMTFVGYGAHYTKRLYFVRGYWETSKPHLV